ncbi:LLM class flavin-dependent oxidoreductase [Arthrobacter sp. I2-34]|uniref:LLM class flavin-dependent oxidoreductase n=1 Tax=Arthrobacter hankyongi TaxID=2904801 RepID=A0ABS9L7E7_9MICC|nr:LLM class flavin-dependent oxidoreductase [Arthrobacter hankyongi]MCG2622600.1 LLM class flavin-dependent oxidoreductase [Arthrobacter hankyongi]
MKFGIFNIPYASEYANGKRTLREVIDWDLQLTRWADQYGLDEAYFAEHYTLGGEPSPAPDAMIAAASQITERITLGAAAHLLPYHNPVALAHRMMWLDHMTGGRYIAGVAPGAYPSDAQLFGTGKNNPKMMVEALDIIEAIWTKPGPFTIEGEFFSVDMPAYDDDIHGPHLKSLQPRIPIMLTGMQAKSPTLTEAGRRGALPLSQQVHESVLVQHWETYAAAATAAGHTPRRSDWRICRDIFVADTDAEARRNVLDGAMGTLWEKYNIPTFASLGIGELLSGGQVPVDELDLDWMIDNFLIVGSPDTVAQKVTDLYEATGGFGTVVSFAHEYLNDPEPYRRSFELLGTAVAPQLKELFPND